jgi:ankyrin repeat protein
MKSSIPVSKRRRLNQVCDSIRIRMGSASITVSSRLEQEAGMESIAKLVNEGSWNEIISLAAKFPEQIISSPNPSPLALACRAGAPLECIQAILNAAPAQIRVLLDSRGTPLHEAIVCESSGPNVIQALLNADEELGCDTTRATLLQDVDGFVPLHLLIRRRFQSHILSLDEDMSLMEILEMLVSSCPESVAIPDRGEYEEPPLVYALKANIYAPSLGSEEGTLARVERQIYEMVQIMLKYAPYSASRIFSGFRGQYTALHSAVFHGRYTTTIDLILKTESEFPHPQNAALLANTQGELPLHFCAMRGERPLTVAHLVQASPAAVLYRDASGLTPFHWLWIRFVSTLMSMGDDDAREFTLYRRTDRLDPSELNQYNLFTQIESGDFDTDLQLVRRLDPPVDFLRMRHIPVEVISDPACIAWCNRTVDILEGARERFFSFQETEIERTETWTRQDSVVSLFWTKTVSLLEAARGAAENQPSGSSVLVHTAFATTCCPPSVAYIVASMFPQELCTPDNYGRLPIHYAASRPWHAWDWRQEENPASKLLSRESIEAIYIALRISPPYAARVADKENRIVLHNIIDTFVTESSNVQPNSKHCVIRDLLSVLHEVLALYPDSLQRRDGVSKLYPFLQVTATATEVSREAFVHDELSLSLTYELLRENPALLQMER